MKIFLLFKGFVDHYGLVFKIKARPGQQVKFLTWFLFRFTKIEYKSTGSK